MSIKRKIIIAFLSVALLIGALGGIFIYHEVAETEGIAIKEASDIAKLLSQFLAHHLAEESGPARESLHKSRLQAHIREFIRVENRDITVVDADKMIIADATPEEIGAVFSYDKNDEVGRTLKDGKTRVFVEEAHIAHPQEMKQLIVPLEADGERVGGLILEYTPLYSALRKEAIESATRYLVFYLIALGASLFIGHLIAKRISQPLREVKEAAAKMASGDLNVRVGHATPDELGSLAGSFNQMAESLKTHLEGVILTNKMLEEAIAERIKVEDVLRQSEEKFHTLFESANDAIFILDLEGNFIDANRTAYERLGYTKEELLSTHISRLDSPEFASKVPERYEQLRRTGRAVFEAAHRRKDGSFMPVEVNARLIDFEGRTVLLSVIRDITRRKRIENALKESQKRLRSLIDAIPDTVFFKDKDGRHLIVNRAHEEVFGIKDIVGKTIEDILPPEAAARCRRGDEEVMKGGKPVRNEEGITDKNGNRLVLDTIKVPLYDDGGNAVGLVGVARDITEKKQAETELKRHRENLEVLVAERSAELRAAYESLKKETAERVKMEEELIRSQKLESLGLLAGGIAHDFNNTLTAIINNIALIRMSGRIDDFTHGRLAAVEKTALKAQTLTQQLLTFSKGGQPLLRTARLDGFLKDTADFALRGSNVRSEYSVPDGLWPVRIDEGQISQAINNIVINACQAMPSGGTVGITAANYEATGLEPLPLGTGRYVKLSIKDSGIGISGEHLPKIFDPYFTTKQQGSGLGLAMAYSIIRKHEGHIGVESILGKGTTFHVYLPASAEAELPAEEAFESLYRGTGRVLVLDDDAAIRDSLSRILDFLGYEAVFTAEGAEVVRIYSEALAAGRPFTAVIMDLTIPGGMGGLDAMRALLEVDPSAKAIVSSGYYNDPVMANFKDYGFKGVLAKPYRVQALGEALRKITGR